MRGTPASILVRVTVKPCRLSSGHWARLGAILHAAGIKSANKGLCLGGLLVAVLGQSLVACAYTVLVASALRPPAAADPSLPSWPLWRVALFHDKAAPAKTSKERPEVPTAQHLTLGLVGTASFVASSSQFSSLDFSKACSVGFRFLRLI